MFTEHQAVFEPNWHLALHGGAWACWQPLYLRL